MFLSKSVRFPSLLLSSFFMAGGPLNMLKFEYSDVFFLMSLGLGITEDCFNSS